MRKIPVLVAGGLVAAIALTGCSSATPASSSPVKLSMWTGFTGGDRPAYEALISDFNASHKNIQVTMDVQPWDTIAQKLPAAWATGQGPDLATPNFDPNIISKYLETNSLLPLEATGNGATDINVDKLAPSAIKAFTAKGKLYAVPANIATLQLYYSKKAFAAAGIADAPKTVTEFQDDAKKLTTGGNYGLALADHETIQMWPVLQWLDGADIVDTKGCAVIDSAKSVSSLTTWANLVTKDKVAPVGKTGAEADSLFSAGKAAMEINGPWAAAGFKSAGVDFGVAAIPAGVNGTVTLASTVPLAIGKSTKHPKETQEFLAWYTGKSAQTKFALASGFPPVRTDLGADAQLSGSAIVSSFAAALPTARLYLPGVTGATQVDSEVYVPFIGQITRGQDVAKAAADAAKKIDAITGCRG